MPRSLDPEALTGSHELRGFDSGGESLDVWLVEHAIHAAAAGSARPFVIQDTEQDRVVAYYALTTASVTHDRATRRAARGMPRHAIPAALLARLAVDRTVQKQGLGAWLLRDAMLRTLSAAESVGIRILLVHAIGDEARAFYEHHGFEASPTDSHNLQMLIKDIRAAVEAGGAT